MAPTDHVKTAAGTRQRACATHRETRRRREQRVTVTLFTPLARPPHAFFAALQQKRRAAGEVYALAGFGAAPAQLTGAAGRRGAYAEAAKGKPARAGIASLPDPAFAAVIRPGQTCARFKPVGL